MADRVSITREQWGRYERGLSVPGGDVLGALALLGADISYVLTGTDVNRTPTALSDEERVLLSEYRKAPLAIRHAALGALVGAHVAEAGPKYTVTIHGQVGQSISGDATIHHHAPAPRKRGAKKP